MLGKCSLTVNLVWPAMVKDLDMNIFSWQQEGEKGVLHLLLDMVSLRNVFVLLS